MFTAAAYKLYMSNTNRDRNTHSAGRFRRFLHWTVILFRARALPLPPPAFTCTGQKNKWPKHSPSAMWVWFVLLFFYQETQNLCWTFKSWCWLLGRSVRVRVPDGFIGFLCFWCWWLLGFWSIRRLLSCCTSHRQNTQLQNPATLWDMHPK